MKTLIFTLIISSTLSLAAPLDPVKEYRDRQEKSTPESVLKWLKDGNQRYATGKATQGGFFSDATLRRKIAAKGQRPLAAVLSCIDSRTTPEIVFDTSIGDLFTARTGGNTIGNDVLGSLEISVASGVKLVVVLGHSDCGGVKAACNKVEFEHMTPIFKRIEPVIEKFNKQLDADPELSKKIGPRTTKNRKYIAAVSHMNAKQSVEHVLAKSKFLRAQVAAGNVKIIPALYNVDTGRVLF